MRDTRDVYVTLKEAALGNRQVNVRITLKMTLRKCLVKIGGAWN
jgi:hypothetical protein